MRRSSPSHLPNRARHCGPLYGGKPVVRTWRGSSVAARTVVASGNELAEYPSAFQNDFGPWCSVRNRAPHDHGRAGTRGAAFSRSGAAKMDGRITARWAGGAAAFARDRGCASAGSAAAFERGHPAGGGLSSWGHREFLHAHCAGKCGAISRSKHALLPVLRGDDVGGVRRLRSSISPTLRPHGSHYAARRAPCFDALDPRHRWHGRPSFSAGLCHQVCADVAQSQLRRRRLPADVRAGEPARANDRRLATRVVAANAFIISALVVGLAFARVLRLGASDSFTTGVLFAVRNVGLATAIAITLLGRLEYAVFAAVYFATEVPLLFGAVALYRRWWARASDAAKAPAVSELHP